MKRSALAMQPTAVVCVVSRQLARLKLSSTAMDATAMAVQSQFKSILQYFAHFQLSMLPLLTSLVLTRY